MWPALLSLCRVSGMEAADASISDFQFPERIPVGTDVEDTWKTLKRLPECCSMYQCNHIQYPACQRARHCEGVAFKPRDVAGGSASLRKCRWLAGTSDESSVEGHGRQASPSARHVELKTRREHHLEGLLSNKRGKESSVLFISLWHGTEPHQEKK